MGEVAEQVGPFVTAYSGDLRDESLDGQRVVVGGIVTGVRTVITKAKATMAIVTIEDLQGTIEVVVFPRLYEQTAADLARRRDPARRRAGRPQGRGGLAAGRPRGRLGRGCGGRRGGLRAPGRGRRARRGGRRGGHGGERERRQRQRAAPGRVRGRGAAARAGRAGPAGRRRGRRGAGRRGGVRPRPVRLPAPRRRRRAPRAPVAGLPADRAGRARLDLSRDRRASRPGPDQDDEPAVPDEARARIVADATRRRADRRRPGHDPPRPVRRQRRRPTGWSARWRRSRPSCATDRARRRVVIHVPAPGGERPCRWSCAAASPTTPSCWPRSAAGSATAWSTSASPEPGTWRLSRRRPARAASRRARPVASASASGRRRSRRLRPPAGHAPPCAASPGSSPDHRGE